MRKSRVEREREIGRTARGEEREERERERQIWKERYMEGEGEQQIGTHREESYNI